MPSPSRVAVREENGELVAEIFPHAERRRKAGMIGIVMGSMAAFEAVTLTVVFNAPPLAVHALTVIWALVFAILAREMIHLLAGREVVRAGRSGLRFRRYYLGLGWDRFYPAGLCTAVRLTWEEGSPLAGVRMGPFGGSLWFACRDRYVSFGRDLPEDEAKVLAARLNAAARQGERGSTAAPGD
jgi:hypothetical protein